MRRHVPNHYHRTEAMLMPVFVYYLVIGVGFACAVLAFLIVLAACLRDWRGQR